MAIAKDKAKSKLKDMEKQHRKVIKINQRIVSNGGKGKGVEKKILTSSKERMERLF
jgi:hypothetical protein